MIKCGYLGDYYLNNVALLILHLEIVLIVIKNSLSSFNRSKLYFY